MGNHDSLRYSQTVAKNIEIQLPLFTYKSFGFSHCPIHPDELRNKSEISTGTYIMQY